MNEMQGKWSYQSVSSFLSESYSALSPQAALAAPVQALAGVTSDMATMLHRFGISTVMDLAASGLFDAARRIVAVADSQSSSGHVPGDLVDAAYRGKGANVLAAAPITALNGIGAAKDARLASALGVTSIRDLADWRPYRNASAILQQAYGASESIVDDPERPDDLIPIPRRYATERVQYDVIVLDRVIVESAGTTHDDATPATMVPPSAPVSPSKLQDIVTAGGIDISDIVSSTLTAKLAVGAVLTYRQSWFPQGLALGQLLHSMALAPGESTRIAMVDWSRRVRGSSADDTTQTELLAADMGRARSMGEVTSSVAREAQSGFSGSASVATEDQSGTTSGQSNVGVSAGVKSPGLLASIGAAIFGGEGASAQVGIGSSSSGTSSANSTATTNATGWASSNGSRSLNAEMQQNISDRTHQAANSVRNRRATAVTETSQEESEKLSTRVVTNYNHMHALTIQYFEVVQIYRVVVELSRVTRCLFIPMKLVTFTNATIRRFRDVIARAALIPGVRALQWAEPDNVVIHAPAKAGPWSAFWLNAVSKALGDEIGFPNDASIVLPKVGLQIHTVGGDLQAMFEELIVEFNDGTTRRNPIPERKADDVWGWQGYSVDVLKSGAALSLESPDRFRRLVLKRRVGQETKAGVANIHLLYNIRLPDGTQLGDRPDLDAPTLVLPVSIRYESNEPHTVAFEFGVTLAQADVLSHLNQNALHYSSAIWRSLDAATITTMLSSYSLGNRPLIEQIDPLPVAVSGNYVIFRSYADENDKEWHSFLKRHQLLEPTPQEDMVPLPSSGVFAEAVLGRSNSAEKLDITRFWNWQDSPIPILPPEINPLSAGGKANDPTVRTAALEGQVLNIVNPPALPDPAGLGPLYSAIANGNMFRDMSGMAQVAALAQAALQTAQAGAGSATGAAGQAQQVAATQLTEFLKLIAQVATGAMTSGGSAGLGAIGAIGGAAAGGAPAKPGVANTPTNAGALINHGKSMDDRGLTGPLPPSSAGPVTPSGDPASEWLPYPGGGSTSGSTAVGTNREREAHAADVALTGRGGGGGGGKLPLAVLNTMLGALPPVLRVPDSRACCALQAYDTIFSEPIDPAKAVGHVYGSSSTKNCGYVYTEKAALLDIAHIRDHIDLTKYAYDAIMAGGTTFNCREGRVTLNQSPKDPLLLAQAIAFADSWAHELKTFADAFEDYSSFSPEDMVSNFVGTYIGGRAIALAGTGSSFNAAVDTLLAGLLSSLGARSAVETHTAIKSKSGKWFDPLPSRALHHRNFEVVPWFMGMPFDKPPAPSFIDSSLVTSVFNDFLYVVSSPLADGSIPTLADFPSTTARLRAPLAAAGKDKP